MLKTVIRWSLTIFFYIGRIIPINQRKIVLSNFLGNNFGDNPKAIADELHKICPDLEFVWGVKRNYEEMPSWIRQVNNRSLKYLIELITAKVWIDNIRKPMYYRKRKNQFYIQTWHGSLALKRVEGDIDFDLPQWLIDQGKHDSQMADLFISNSSFCSEMYRRAFWYEGKILECGSPRCDQLFHSCSGNKVHKNFNIPNNTKIVLYAPTFRKGHRLDVYDVDFGRLIRVLESKYNQSVVVLVRMHPNLANDNININYCDNIINATSYPDMYELLAEVDFLITDYSSTLFEMSYARKPVWIYATDVEDYCNDRGLYFDIYNLPYPIATNNDELDMIVSNFDEEIYRIKLNEFFDSVGLKENGTSSKMIAEYLRDNVLKK